MSSETKLGRPAKPEELPEVPVETKPAFVYDAVNALLARQRDRRNIHIEKIRLENEIKSRLPDGMMFEWRWMGIESDYANFGWDVELVHPDYDENESFEPFYRFKPAKPQ